MNSRGRGVLLGLVVVASTLALAALYHRYVWSSADATLAWVRGGTTYVLRSPKLLGLVLLAPLFLLILPRSLADLPWQQQALSVLLRVSFVVLLALSLARVARTEKAEKVCT